MIKPSLGIIIAISIGLTTCSFAESVSWQNSQEAKLLLASVPVKKAAAHTAASSNASRDLQVGISNFNRGYIAKALPFFEKATQQTPNNESAWLWLARGYQKQGTPMDFEKAKTAFQRVLGINPNNTEALSSLGELWSWDPSKRNDAIQLLTRAYDRNPADAATAKKLSEALFWQGRSTEALRYAAPIANRYQSDRKFMSEYADILSQTGHADQALVIYNTILKTESSKQLPLKLDLARAFLKDGQVQKAQAVYAEINQSSRNSALARDDNFGQAMAGLAFELGFYSECIAWDQSLSSALQRQKDIQLRDARALIRANRTPEAIEKFQRLYDASLLTADEKLEYGDYLRQLHLEASALPSPDIIENLYKEAAQEAPESGEVYVRLARLYSEKDGAFQDTVQAYQKALSNTLNNHDSVQKEFLDFIKSDKTQPAAVEALFQQMLSDTPNNLSVKTAYAEFLSWQKDRRAEALRIYVDLAKANLDQRDMWEGRIEEVLRWHQPTTALIPLYQDIVNLYPQSKPIWLTVARAYRNDKSYYKEAVETYSLMVQRYPDDGSIKREWLGLLTSNDSQRGENIKLLQKMTQENPSDLDILATYGKLLSYDHQYGKGMDAFDEVLHQNPEHSDALVGKGYIILWSGRKFEAKNYFVELRQKYPDNVDVAIGLAQTEKLIGRYDQAMKIIEEIQPLLQKNPDADRALKSSLDFVLVDYESGYESTGDSLLAEATYDFSILPYSQEQPTPSASSATSPALPSRAERQLPTTAPVSMMAIPSAAALTQPTAAQTTVTPSANPELRSLQSELDALTDAVNSLKALQQSSRRQLDRIGQTVQTTRDMANGDTVFHSSDTVAAGQTGFGGKQSVGESGLTPAYGTYAALDSDTNPLLSGMGRFKNDELSDLEKGLLNELRPMIRGGFSFTTQDADPTTTSMNSWGFPNQISFSLTPQIRLRGGMRPVKYYLPEGLNPSSTWGWEYGGGATVKYWDRLTLDSDLAITHFTQSGSTNLTFQTQAAYAINDYITVKLGARRMPQYNSLLAIAGQRPSMGAFSNQLVGQARENTFYGELNTHPFTPNLDWNLGYEWGFVDGSRIPNNIKNQAFTSLGYTWHYSANHQVRLGYEFLYFGYSKNATNGYFDTTAVGLTRPVASLQPLGLANNGYVFGGYYSPSMFIMNAGRLDFRGSLFNKFLEYKLGGSLGAQTVRLGHKLDNKEDGGGTSMATSFDANLIMNLTDWLAAYGNVDYLNAGLQFNRWRFGGGLILRPHIGPLSPMFGQPIDRRR